jgi:predicted small integral membrane protein
METKAAVRTFLEEIGLWAAASPLGNPAIRLPRFRSARAREYRVGLLDDLAWLERGSREPHFLMWF